MNYNGGDKHIFFTCSKTIMLISIQTITFKTVFDMFAVVSAFLQILLGVINFYLVHKFHHVWSGMDLKGKK